MASLLADSSVVASPASLAGGGGVSATEGTDGPGSPEVADTSMVESTNNNSAATDTTNDNQENLGDGGGDGPNNTSNVGSVGLNTSTDKWTLLQQYRGARDAYLRHKLRHGVLEMGRTFDGRTFEVGPNSNTNEEQTQQELRDRRSAVLAEVQRTADTVRQLELEGEVRTAALEARHDEVELMKRSVGRSSAEHRDDDDDSGSVHTTDSERGDVDVDDDELQAEADRIESLRQRRARLLQRLRTVEDETEDCIQSLQREGAKLPPPMADETITEATLTGEQEKTAELQSTLDRYEEMTAFYGTMRLVMEELRGVRVLSVEHRNNSNDGDADGKDVSANKSDNNNNLMVLTLVLLNTYEVQVGLEAIVPKHPSQSERLKIKSARYGDSPPANESKMKEPLPRLDDLVQTANKQGKNNSSDNNSSGGGRNNSLRLFVVETLARLTNREARAPELALLFQQQQQQGHPGIMVVESVRVVPSEQRAGGGQAASDQSLAVVCAIRRRCPPSPAAATTVQLVLRLTPDCPAVDGSVYLCDVVGEGWDADRIEAFRERIGNGSDSNNQQQKQRTFRRPIDLLRAAQDQLIQEQQEEEQKQQQLSSD